MDLGDLQHCSGKLSVKYHEHSLSLIEHAVEKKAGGQ
jgi:hypothetical protein